MIRYKKIIITLVALLAVTTGAWADETPLLTIESTDYTTFTSGSKTFDNKVTVTFSNPVTNSGNSRGWYANPTASLMTVAGTNGYTITSCKFYTEGGIALTGYTVPGESPSVYLYAKEVFTDASKSVKIGDRGIMKIEVYGAAASSATEWPLTSQDGKTWTLAKMPANNIELQVEYYAESNLFLSKDALADKANIAVKNGETAVDFDADGKSTTTVTEGNTVTVTYTGSKKVIGVKAEKKAAEPVADIVWDVTNVSDLSVPGTESYEKEGVTLRANAVMIHAMWYNYGDPTTAGIGFNTDEPGGFTFTAPTGKKFTKIEMTLTGSVDWESRNLGTGWAFNADMVKNILTVTWTGSAASTVDLLKDTDDFSGANVKSIAFYLSE